MGRVRAGSYDGCGVFVDPDRVGAVSSRFRHLGVEFVSPTEGGAIIREESPTSGTFYHYTAEPPDEVEANLRGEGTASVSCVVDDIGEAVAQAVRDMKVDDEQIVPPTVRRRLESGQTIRYRRSTPPGSSDMPEAFFARVRPIGVDVADGERWVGMAFDGQYEIKFGDHADEAWMMGSLHESAFDAAKDIDGLMVLLGYEAE